MLKFFYHVSTYCCFMDQLLFPRIFTNSPIGIWCGRPGRVSSDFTSTHRWLGSPSRATSTLHAQEHNTKQVVAGSSCTGTQAKQCPLLYNSSTVTVLLSTSASLHYSSLNNSMLFSLPPFVSPLVHLAWALHFGDGLDSLVLYNLLLFLNLALIPLLDA